MPLLCRCVCVCVCEWENMYSTWSCQPLLVGDKLHHVLSRLCILQRIRWLPAQCIGCTLYDQFRRLNLREATPVLAESSERDSAPLPIVLGIARVTYRIMRHDFHGFEIVGENTNEYLCLLLPSIWIRPLPEAGGAMIMDGHTVWILIWMVEKLKFRMWKGIATRYSLCSSIDKAVFKFTSRNNTWVRE
jgi:hypothetical protein